jgi:Transglutaminase-like superfamily
VKLASRFVPAATCLAQALVTVTLLEREGLPASLRIGVARSVRGKFEAHAWVESGGRVVIGGTRADLSRFTVMHTLEGE